MKPYDRDKIDFARSLRKEMTLWEKKLWFNFLKNYRPRFQRQKNIGQFIVDFYCAQAKLVIELDGSQHYKDEAPIKDNERTNYLISCGLKVIRFSNSEINTNFAGVCDKIVYEVKKQQNVKN